MITPSLIPSRQPSGLDLGQAVLHAEGIHKQFTLHTQGGVKIPVLQGVSLTVQPGDCVVLAGPSGSGKSTFMRCLYGNYRADRGSVWVNHQRSWLDLTQLDPHRLIEVRQQTIGYVSQFLRVIPRVPAIEVAAEPLLDLGTDPLEAQERVAQLFTRLHLPERLWSLSPTTFSGGEKQRVNLARALSVPYPLLLLDEPTSALDAVNRRVVLELLQERRAQGSALIGIFHDLEIQAHLKPRELLF